MKFSLCSLVLVLAICGCGKNSNTKLENRLTNLEARVELLKTIADQNTIIATDALRIGTNAFGLADTDTDQISELITKLGNYYRATTNIEARLETLELHDAVLMNETK
jgi:hypothetical protein